MLKAIHIALIAGGGLTLSGTSYGVFTALKNKDAVSIAKFVYKKDGIRNELCEEWFESWGYYDWKKDITYPDTCFSLGTEETSSDSEGKPIYWLEIDNKKVETILNSYGLFVNEGGAENNNEQTWTINKESKELTCKKTVPSGNEINQKEKTKVVCREKINSNPSR
ncbi:hypothetical protein MSUIS_05240 [Mycoplasma suis KI3806]|uniref:Uncharacterized protein n=1 Tax=Mycoplasma suis (strain KI_3806) TaxID=708248 RepID=F0V1T6_MYCS3|nr:hypothetical protein [Mycoplasma suis]CBZ40617.1 hypothetical protein MSUIS_05240 [Mycoplasma suis KI3806]